jgi:threonine synthase
VINALKNDIIDIIPVENPKTIASAISVPDPITGNGALLSLKNSKGDGLTVTDEEIIQARIKLGKIGIYAEPSGAVSLAGLYKMQKEWDLHDKTVVCIITGHGLKDTLTGYDVQRTMVEPEVQSLRDVLS